MLKYILWMLCLGATSTISAQTIEGHVMTATENGGMVGLPGAVVQWTDGSGNAICDDDGHFHIEKSGPAQTHLIAQYVGYMNDTMEVGNKRSLHFMLLPVTELETVIVAGDGSATAINTKDPVNLETINKKELLKAACCNLSESFETNNTVDAEYSDAITGAKTIKMLGLDGVYSQIMVENMANVRGLSSSYGLTFIPGSWIESIQVTKGPGSVVNGYESITGSINTELKKPFDTDEEKAYINLYGATSGTLELNADYRHVFNEKWSTGLYFHTNQLHNKMDDNSDGFLDAPLTNHFIVMNKWNYFSGKTHEAQLGVKYIYSDLLGGQTIFDPALPRTIENGYGVNVHIQRMEAFMKNGFVFTRPNTSIGTIVSFAQHDQTGYYGLNDYAGDETYVHGNAIFQTYIGNTNHMLKTGASFLYDHFREDFNTEGYHRDERVPGIFAEYYYNKESSWSLLLGARVDQHNLYGTFFSPRMHVKYNAGKNTVLRVSGGRGYRVANIFAENTNILTSARSLVISEPLDPESGWNYGFTGIRYLKFGQKEGTFTLDLYRTDFTNKVVVDVDSDPHTIYISNLHGDAFSNVLQAEWDQNVFKNFDVRLAYKYIDARETFNGVLREIPLTSKNRGLLNLAYSWKKAGMVFDFTAQGYGTMRLPENLAYTDAALSDGFSPAYVLLLGQITKKWKGIEIYAGSDNLTNFTQQDPIIGATNPFGEEFDASAIYAPVMQRKWYAGLRWSIK
ncbi:MAG: carboxypeptidase-like regulatory domain-containing protein [Chitinophagales bacterium]